ncbi:MAG: hypothetical protein JJ975_00270 [Bacteroidia bacterium]|nr:hypothetical protein [Bacteroidia bacterium]
MTKDINEIRERLVSLLKRHQDVLKIGTNKFENFVVNGTVEAMQGKKKVDGIYFASVVPKPKDVRFYFFPSYTHKEGLGELPENLQKALKGKSCFYIKYMDDELEKNLGDLIEQAIGLYQEDGLLAK